MKKFDARKLPKEVQQHNRDQAIRLFHQGKTPKEIALIVGVHYVVTIFVAGVKCGDLICCVVCYFDSEGYFVFSSW